MKVANCRALGTRVEVARSEDGAGPAVTEAEESQDNSISEFATQCLNEEVLAAPRGSNGRAPSRERQQETIQGKLREAETQASGSIEARSNDSNESEWRPAYCDFAGDESSIAYSESNPDSEEGSIDLQHEIGFYDANEDLDELKFRARYHDRFWQSTDTMLLGDRVSFQSPHPGPKVRSSCRKPATLEFFELFFDDLVATQMVEQTNLYAEQQGPGRSQHTNGGPHWVPTCALEMRAFIGVTILMGIKLMPTIRDYWKKNEFLHCSMIPRVFIRNRFESLLHCLHLVDNRNNDTNKKSTGYDKLAKVRWIIGDFVRKSRALYNPGKFITCDEIMLAYRGHYLGFR